jgi:TPR repeat protein
MNEKNPSHFDNGGMSQEHRARLIRETEDKIKQDPIYQLCVEREMDENTIDSHKKTSSYDTLTIKQYQKAAENGDSDAMIVLAKIYKRGEGVMKDSDRALFWYQKAAEAGNVAAIYHIARRYDLLVSLGNSSEDVIKAIKWYTKAAEAGRCDAMNRLGWMYLIGKGVGKDCKKAIEWFLKAAEAGQLRERYRYHTRLR